MKKFVFVYHGKVSSEPMSNEEMKQITDKWMSWFGTFKDNMVDGGNPFAPGGTSVSPKGNHAIAADQFAATGYTIINASDMDEATKIAKGCPVLENNEGTVRVYEALPM